MNAPSPIPLPGELTATGLAGPRRVSRVQHRPACRGGARHGHDTTEGRVNGTGDSHVHHNRPAADEEANR
jgi:hypothetical protein